MRSFTTTPFTLILVAAVPVTVVVTAALLTPPQAAPEQCQVPVAREIRYAQPPPVRHQFAQPPPRTRAPQGPEMNISF